MLFSVVFRKCIFMQQPLYKARSADITIEKKYNIFNKRKVFKEGVYF